MGITITGLLVRMGEDKVPGVLEYLFDRKIVSSTVIKCDYYRLFEAFDTWEIAAVYDGQNTALFFGEGNYGKGFSWLANKMFPGRTVDKIPSDYLFYSFVESAMGFIFSYKKNGGLYESYFGMNGEEFVHLGDDLLGLTLEHDIAQDGLYLALQEFGIDVNKIEKATVYTFSAEAQKAAEPDNKRADEKDINLRYLVGKFSREIHTSVKNKNANFSALATQALNTLNQRHIAIKHIKLVNEDYKACKETWSKLNSKALEKLETDLIDRIILQTDTEKAFAQLVYINTFNEYKKTKTELIKSLVPAIAVAIILIVIALIIFIQYYL